MPESDVGVVVTFPSHVVNLKPWKLTVPKCAKSSGGRCRELVEVKQPKLATFTDEFFRLTDDNQGVLFHCPHRGAVVEHHGSHGSDNPRSELREMSSDGLSVFDWSTNKGRHKLTLEGQVNQITTNRKHVVIAQIHGGDDDLTVFRVEDEKLFITVGDHVHIPVPGDFPWGVRYELRFEVAGGDIDYFVNGTKVHTLSKNASGCYFKAGNYLQSHTGPPHAEPGSGFSDVVIYKLTIEHHS